MGARPEHEVRVRPLVEADLAAADRVLRLAFGTFLGLPEPERCFGDVDFVRTRWRADPAAAFASELNGQIVGSNFATRWGSVAFFGPLTVRPDLWERGVGRRLMGPVLERFDAWGTQHAGLYTFAHSAKHVGLYQKFGFWPGQLTAIMGKPIGRPVPVRSWSLYSDLAPAEWSGCLAACAALTDSVHAGLDVEREIRAVAEQKLGDTVLLWDGSRLVGFAVCHAGPGSEAGSGVCYVKFGVVRSGANAGALLDRLLDACETLAAARGAARLTAGVNTGRHAAYRRLLDRGFRTELQGVAMHRPDGPGYNRPEVHVLDDWR